MKEFKHEFITPTDSLDIRLEYTVDPGNHLFYRHFHDWIEIVYLIEGDLEMQVENTNIVMEANDFVVVNAMSVHSTKCVNGNKTILMQVPLSFLEKFVPDIREYRFKVDLRSEDPKVRTKLDNIRKELEDLWIAYQFKVDGHIFRCYSLIFEIIYILVHSFSRKIDLKEKHKNEKNIERLKKVQDYVMEHYTEPILIAQIAKEMGLNEIYFSRFFKSAMGITFGDYLNTVRMEKIYWDIKNTNLPIKDIQAKHGFNNDRVFRRVFKEMYGCLPKEARRQ